ncbi:hypothetical protein NGM10_11475 [Halorussus salilacus]|uniref:hypothetical protein n=1 Tax=Halorussus salilacus TaxID=2953750 RepID=UPI00209FBC0D|nr:hypothetical protein [Halorussus salilacus]USZ67350.1 hypothetical protein NGM10_11475 [Halorussus salilacus]
MRLTRRELIGYGVAGATGMGVTAAGRQYRPDDPEDAGVDQTWELGGVRARPATVEESAITFRASVWSQFETDYDVRVVLRYGPKDGDADDWRTLAEEEGPLSEGLYLEATASDLESGATYRYQAEAFLTNFDEGPSRRVSRVREVTAGEPCSGPSTNCLRVETLAPETSDGDGEVTLRGRARGLDAYDEVTGHFFYRREGGSEAWTGYEPIEGDGSDGSDEAEFSATLSDLPEGTYTYYAEARGEGDDWKNMYGEGGERSFAVGADGEVTETPEGTETPADDETTESAPEETTESATEETTDTGDPETTDSEPPETETADASLPNRVVIFGGGGSSRISYELAVSGRIEKDDSAGDAPIADRYVSVDSEDAISGSTASGVVAGGGDAYLFSGSVREFTADGNAQVYVNGQRRR